MWRRPIHFIDLDAQQERIRSSLERRVARVLKHGQYILGPEVDELEAILADRVGVRHCVGVANGTDALQLALMAIGVGPGDEVVTPAFSYIAAAEAAALLGAVPVFVDIDPTSFHVDPSSIESAVTERTKAIVPVDLFGQCADYDAIHRVATKHGIPVIEDAAQSFGAHYHGRPAASLGCIATTSFFPSKPLGCYGDGGACFTNDDHLAMLLRSMRAHGQGKRYYHERIGVNARLDTLQAAVLLAKLEVFDDEIEKRNLVAQRYHTLIAEAGLLERGVVIPVASAECSSVWAQYTIRVPRRDNVASHMKNAAIPSAIHYPRALHEQDVFRPLAKLSVPLLQSEIAASEVLSLPMHPYLTVADQQRVVVALSNALGS